MQRRGYRRSDGRRARRRGTARGRLERKPSIPRRLVSPLGCRCRSSSCHGSCSCPSSHRSRPCSCRPWRRRAPCRRRPRCFRALVQATLPQSDPKQNELVRRNGHLTRSILAPEDAGLPYGRYPRLVSAYLDTEAVRRKTRHIELDHHFSRFCGLTWRFFGLRKPVAIPWASLALQFGCSDANPRHFEERFLGYLRSVIEYDPDVRLESPSSGLLSKPSPTYVTRRGARRRPRRSEATCRLGRGRPSRATAGSRRCGGAAWASGGSSEAFSTGPRDRMRHSFIRQLLRARGDDRRA
jgi:hypothetical protein